MNKQSFEWDETKNRANQNAHGISFELAQDAFYDENRIIIRDLAHSSGEQRFFCLGWVVGGVLTVRFTLRRDKIRIYGAGYWRQGKKRYEQENKI